MTDFNEMVLRDRQARAVKQKVAGLATDREARDDARGAGAGHMAKKRTAKRSRPKSQGHSVASAIEPRKGDWWRAYTQFVDVIGPRLTLAEREVWHVMLRRSSKWVCETTARTMATAANIDKGTASKAFATLEAIGLIWTIWKSTDNTKPSSYGLHPQPSECLAKLLKWEARK